MEHERHGAPLQASPLASLPSHRPHWARPCVWTSDNCCWGSRAGRGPTDPSAEAVPEDPHLLTPSLVTRPTLTLPGSPRGQAGVSQLLPLTALPPEGATSWLATGVQRGHGLAWPGPSPSRPLRPWAEPARLCGAGAAPSGSPVPTPGSDTAPTPATPPPPKTGVRAPASVSPRVTHFGQSWP